jgi:hypothetical protein
MIDFHDIDNIDYSNNEFYNNGKYIQFYDFMVENGVYHKIVKNFNNMLNKDNEYNRNWVRIHWDGDVNSLYDYVDSFCKRNRCYNLFVNMFSWGRSVEGSSFWYDINKKWKKIIKYDRLQ